MKLFIDAHTHLDDEAFDADRDNIIKSFNDDGVKLVINASSDLKSSLASYELAKINKNIYAVVGVHPHEASGFSEKDIEEYKSMLEDKKIVGIGECGLDYHYDLSPRDIQKKVFERMIEFANEMDEPLVIHSREAVKDTLDMLFLLRKDRPTLIHCFTGAVEVARDYLNLGYYLSIGGAVTFKNAKHVVESVKYAPLDRLMLETDAPYMTPVPFRGKRNEPKLIKYTITKIAEIKGISEEEVIDATNKNALEFYNIDD
ncbi:MAG: TatD family hydrolase [Ezakiella sp.]|nr:TatD family hydrolase [Ezakiella sp.]